MCGAEPSGDTDGVIDMDTGRHKGQSRSTAQCHETSHPGTVATSGTLLLLPYTGLGPFRALKVQSKLVCLGGGGVCILKQLT